jgi:hypothetical protein
MFIKRTSNKNESWNSNYWASHIEFLENLKWFMCYTEMVIYGKLVIMGQYDCKWELPINLPYQISTKAVKLFMLWVAKSIYGVMYSRLYYRLIWLKMRAAQQLLL